VASCSAVKIVDWIQLAEDRVKLFEKNIETFGFIKHWKFLDHLSKYQLLKKDPCPKT
jgi:hypothetical protein